MLVSCIYAFVGWGEERVGEVGWVGGTFALLNTASIIPQECHWVQFEQTVVIISCV